MFIPHFQMGKVLHNNKTHNQDNYCIFTTYDDDANEANVEVVMCFEPADVGKYAFLPIGK